MANDGLAMDVFVGSQRQLPFDGHFPILLHGALTFRAAGLVRSVVSRCADLANAHYAPEIFVPVFEPLLDDETVQLYNSGRLPRSVLVHNLFEDLEQVDRSEHLPAIDASPPSFFREGLRSVVDSENSRVVRYYQDSEYVAYEYRLADRRTQFVDLLADGRRYRRLTYNSRGYVSRSTTFDEGNNAIFHEYYDAAGFRFLYSNVKDGRERALTYFDGDLLEHTFDTLDELTAFWIETHYGRLLQSRFLVSEWAFHRQTLQHLKEQIGTRIIVAFHNNHFAFPHRYGSPYKPELESTLSNLSLFDAVVVLTESQRIDILKDFPDCTKIEVIPHASPLVPERPLAARDSNLVVFVGRLSREKGVLEIVELLPELISLVPSVKFEFWGRGPLEESLNSRIEELDIGSNVRLAGFTESPELVYSAAAVSLFPSQYEGQSLSLLESQAFGAVPVAFRFNYGAVEHIQHGVNGLLVDPDSYTDLLRSCALLLTRPYWRETLSRNAQIAAMNNSSELLVDRWTGLLRSLGGISIRG